MFPGRVALALGFVGLTCLLAPGQYHPGDILVVDMMNQILLGISPTGKLSTVTTPMPLCALVTSPDNRSVWVSGFYPSTTAKIAPDGTVTRLFPLGFHALCVGPGGSVFGVTGPQIVKLSGSKATTLYSGPTFSHFVGVRIDLPSGNLLAADKNSGFFQVSLRGNLVSTFSVVLSPWSLALGLHEEPDTGSMIGVWGPAVYRLRPGAPAKLTTLYSGAPLNNAAWVERDPRDGRYLVVDSPVQNWLPYVFRFDPGWKRFTTVAAITAPWAKPATMTIAGSRHLCGLNDPRRGGPYSMLVSSPGEPGARYMVALSFGFRPGIPVGSGRKVYLNPDPLFLASVTGGGPFYGFQGTLDGRGEAVAAVAIPNLAGLSGSRFFASAITIVNNRISVISDPLGVTIQ